jgi:hypothetical protein
MNIVAPLELKTDAGVLSFISTTTVLDTPLDITLSEIVLESFFPRTLQRLRPYVKLLRHFEPNASPYNVEGTRR